MCVNIGHGDARVIRAIEEQARLVEYVTPSLTTEPRARLGAKLATITPGDIDVFFFTNGGAEANENAFKIARAYTGRQRSCRTIAPITARRRAPLRRPANHGAGASRRSQASSMCSIPYHGIARGWDTTSRRFDSSKRLCNSKDLRRLPALIVEPVTGTNGVLVPPDGYLQGLRALCDKHGILLIADEVMSGIRQDRSLVCRRSLAGRSRYPHDGERPDECVRAAGGGRSAAEDRRPLQATSRFRAG